MCSLKKIIFSADDFGKCDEMDYAILKGFEAGVLTSTCIMSNGANYEKAVNEILPRFHTDVSRGSLGFHFNIIEGKSLLKKENSMLCDKDGFYNRGFVCMLLLSANKNFMKEVEQEFRSQIEKLLAGAKEKNFKIDHVNSHVHFHGIPAIFDLTCRLTKEYGIECVRTQYENFYFLPLKKIFSMGIKNAFLNLIKNLILKLFTVINRKTLKKYNLKTNDNFIGLLTTGFMDEQSILDALRAVKTGSGPVEILVHPYIYENNKNFDKNKEKEYLIVQNENFRTILEKEGCKFVNFSRIDE